MISIADLLAPVGPVEVTLFPGENVALEEDPTTTQLELRLQTYIERADARIEGRAFPLPDDAALSWALYLTFEAAYTLAVSRPSATNDQVPILGSESYQKDQRDALAAKAAYYLNQFHLLETTIPTTAPVIAPQSRQIINVYEW